MAESVNIPETYETESGYQLKITKEPAATGQSEWQVEFVDSGKQHKVSVEGRQCKDWKGRQGKVQPVSLDNGAIRECILFEERRWWWRPVISDACFRWKFDDCWTGSISDHDPLRWSELMDNTGLLAEVTLFVADQNSTEFSRPIFVEKYSSAWSKTAETSKKNITQYEDLQKILHDTEDLAFKWKFQKGFGHWSKWMSKAGLQLNLAVSNPDCAHPIEIQIFRGRPGTFGIETCPADSIDSLREVLAKRPRPLHRLLSNGKVAETVVAARLAQEIYKEKGNLEWACEAENGSAFFGIKSARCNTAETCARFESIFVVFRGTVDAMTIFTDLNCTLSTDDPWLKFGLKVHASIWTDLKEALKDGQNKQEDGSYAPGLVCKLFNMWKDKQPAKLVITGHSLGAGLAMMLQAYIWIQANTEECDGDFQKAFDEAPEFKDFLRSSTCVGFAGPMVFAKVEEPEVPAELTTHLTSTVKNYMFREDLVPRAYGALDVESVVKSMGQQLSARHRIKNAILGFVMSRASGKTQNLDGYVQSLKETLDLGKFKKHADQYVHCCQVVVIGQRGVAWNRLNVTLEALYHHKMTTYRTSLEWPTAETFTETLVQWAKEAPEAATPESALNESSIWSSARNADWTHVLIALSNKHPDSFEPPEAESPEANHFVHLAALQGEEDGKKILIELLRRGANPLRRNKNNKSIVEVVTLEESHPFKAWLAGLVDLAEELKSVGCEGSDLAKQIITQWDESRHLMNLSKDTLCQLKRQNLELLGIQKEQIEDGEDRSESFSDALARIEKKHGKETLKKQQSEYKENEKIHRFLDSAKWGDYSQMHEMLEQDPTLANKRILTRWTALMQVVYNSTCCGEIDMQDVVTLLLCYPDVDAIRSAQKDIIKVQTRVVKKAKQQDEGSESEDSPRLRGSSISSRLAEASPDMKKVGVLLDKIYGLAEGQEKHEFDIKTLVNDIRKSDPDLFT